MMEPETTALVVYPFLSILSFTWGACIGSFLNVCIYRIPRALSVIAPRSHCPQCKAKIAWYDNIPLVSFFLLGMRCRRCHGRISPRYFVVELLTACLFLLIWLKFGFESEPRPLGLHGVSSAVLVPIYWLAISGLILGTFVDLEHMIIPDRVSVGGVVAGVLLSVLYPELQGQSKVLGGLQASVIGAVAGGGMLWAIARIGTLLFRKEAMGLGDVKLLAAIGAFLGWRAVLFALMLSSLSGSVLGVTLVVVGRKGMRSRIPYGPHLAVAAIVWILWGPAIWSWYLNLFVAAAG